MDAERPVTIPTETVETRRREEWGWETELKKPGIDFVNPMPSPQVS